MAPAASWACIAWLRTPPFIPIAMALGNRFLPLWCEKLNNREDVMVAPALLESALARA